MIHPVRTQAYGGLDFEHLEETLEPLLDRGKLQLAALQVYWRSMRLFQAIAVLPLRRSVSDLLE